MVRRTLNKLSARSVDAKRKPGLYGDGGGLWLQVSPSGSKSWLFRFMLRGRAREMGLGSYLTVTLNEAREAAGAQRKILAAGIDPIQARNDGASRSRLEAARAMTFRQCADAYVKTHRAAWKNAKHASQWKNTLETYAYPVLGDMPVQSVDTDAVLRVLTPIWETKTETASRLRGRIESVLDWAKARGLRAGDNPASWRGHLKKLLPERSKVTPIEHHPALPYVKLPAFIAALRKQDGIAARALEFTILCASRTSEVIGAKWAEVDLAEKVWTVPGARMKGRRDKPRPHRVPLPPRAVALLREMAKIKTSDYLFPGRGADEPLSNNAMLALLDRMGTKDVTTHGFRSTFRDWAAEQTNFAREVAEAALAHALGDKVEAAYRRGDLFAKRRALMDTWAVYCATERPVAKVLPMRKRQR